MEYELAFRGPSTAIDGIAADLSSPHLDTQMHPRGTTRLLIATRSANSRASQPNFLLDSFQIQSIASYLENQPKIRATIEAELVRSLNELPDDSEKESFSDGSVWNHLLEICVMLSPRQLATPEFLAAARKAAPDVSEESLIATSDTPATRSRFRVCLRPAWDEHITLFDFRDGALLEIATS